MRILTAPKRIANRIILLVLILELISIAIWGTLTYQSAQRELINTISGRLSETNFRTRTEIANFFTPLAIHAEVIGTTLASVPMTDEELRAFLYRAMRSRPEIQELSMFNTSGRELIKLSRSESVADADLRTHIDDAHVKSALSGNRATSEISFSPYFEPEIRLISPVPGKTPTDNKALAFRVNLKWIWDVLQAQRIGASGYVYVVDMDRNLIGHIDPSYVLARLSVSKSEIPPELFVGEGLSTFAQYKNFGGDEVAGVSGYDPINRWWVVVEQPVDEVLAPLYRIIDRFILVFILAATITISLVLLFSRLTMRPLEIFEQGIARIAAGESTVRIDVPVNSELSTLIAGFNRMASNLDGRIHELKEAEIKYRTLIETASDSILVVDEVSGQIQIGNRRAAELFGCSIQALKQLTLDEVLYDGNAVNLRKISDELRRDGFINSRNTAVKGSSGERIPIDLSASRTTVNDLPLLQIAIRDVRERQKLVDELEYQATHDSLTHLPNRKSLIAGIADTLHENSATRKKSALLMIDLDHFKEINDTLGHKAGDLLLKEIRPRLAQILMPSDLLTRLGGDEFAILVRDVSSDPALVDKAKRIIESIKQPFLVDGLRVQIGASLGIALSPTHGTEVGDLMKCADVAMYHAKNNKLGFAFYNKTLDRYSRERLMLLSDITTALEKEQFALHFHPKVCMKTGQIRGAEALIRWHHPTLGLLFPNEFIPLVEVSERIHDITSWVVNDAIKGCTQWAQCSEANLRISVNLSARNLNNEDLPNIIGKLIDQHGFESQRLEVEITESALIVNPRRSRAVVAALHDCGIRVAIDDFGKGYSSLAYLRQFPIDEIKIDKSFIRKIKSNKNNAAIVRSTIDLAHNLEMTVVAEGVEDGESWDMLRDLGCDLAQSYFVCKPQPQDRFIGWLRNRTENELA